MNLDNISTIIGILGAYFAILARLVSQRGGAS
jgi:hypothetical protein